jgi:PB1 domain
MWNNFWNSTFSQPAEPDQMSQSSEPRASASAYLSYKRSIPDRERIVSPEPSITRESLVSRQPSQSIIRLAPPEIFSFKLKDISNSNKFYRFSSASDSLFALYENVCLKTGGTHSLAPELGSNSNLDIVRKKGEPVRLCYVDEDGDVLCLESDKDLTEAVQMVVNGNSSRLVIYLGDPSSEFSEIKAEAKQHSRHSTVSTEHTLTSKVPKAEKTMFDTLKEAPLSINVAISAGIFVFAYYIIRKIG